MLRLSPRSGVSVDIISGQTSETAAMLIAHEHSDMAAARSKMMNLSAQEAIQISAPMKCRHMLNSVLHRIIVPLVRCVILRHGALRWHNRGNKCRNRLIGSIFAWRRILRCSTFD